MFTKESMIYRQVFTLKDGSRVLVRPLAAEDRQSMLDLFLPVSADDKRYMRHDVNDPAVINGWIDNLDYESQLPLVAVINNHLAGCATLHFLKGPYRHRAEIRIFLSKEFRHRGVGSRMLQGLIELARRRSLHILEVQMVSDQTHMIKAFHNLGFETTCVLENFFIMPDGELHDVHYLALRLRANVNEF